MMVCVVRVFDAYEPQDSDVKVSKKFGIDTFAKSIDICSI